MDVQASWKSALGTSGSLQLTLVQVDPFARTT